VKGNGTATTSNESKVTPGGLVLGARPFGQRSLDPFEISIALGRKLAHQDAVAFDRAGRRRIPGGALGRKTSVAASRPADTIAALTSPVSLGIAVGLVLGKQLGIFGLPFLLSRPGWLRRPAGLEWRQIYGAAWLGGIGFTMSLFITHLAFGDGDGAVRAKVGILVASFVAAVGGSLVLLVANKKKPS